MKSAYVLIGGPRNVALMLEQSGVRYATIFTSEEAVSRFRRECCSATEYQPLYLPNSSDIIEVLEATRKLGCSLLIIDPVSPEITGQRPEMLTAFLRKIAG